MRLWYNRWRLKNYIWDFDGTLFDTYPVMLDALQQTIAKHGILYDGDLAYFIKNTRFENLLWIMPHQNLLMTIIHSKMSFRQMSSFIQKYLLFYLKLSITGVEILSSAIETINLSVFRGFDNLFSEIITSDNHLARKPDPEALTYLIDKYNSDPSETAMVEASTSRYTSRPKCWH